MPTKMAIRPKAMLSNAAMDENIDEVQMLSWVTKYIQILQNALELIYNS